MLVSPIFKGREWRNNITIGSQFVSPAADAAAPPSLTDSSPIDLLKDFPKIRVLLPILGGPDKINCAAERESVFERVVCRVRVRPHDQHLSELPICYCALLVPLYSTWGHSLGCHLLFGGRGKEAYKNIFGAPLRCIWACPKFFQVTEGRSRELEAIATTSSRASTGYAKRPFVGMKRAPKFEIIGIIESNQIKNVPLICWILSD